MKKVFLIIALIATIFTGLYFTMKRPERPTTTANATGISNSAYQIKVEQNKSVVKTEVTSQGFLYVTVANDGTDKTAMATALARQATDSQAFGIKAIKVVDAAGNELGKAFCK